MNTYLTNYLMESLINTCTDGNLTIQTGKRYFLSPLYQYINVIYAGRECLHYYIGITIDYQNSCDPLLILAVHKLIVVFNFLTLLYLVFCAVYSNQEQNVSH